MTTSISSKSSLIRPPGFTLQVAGFALLVGMLAASSLAFASNTHLAQNGSSSDSSTWTPDIVSAIDAYLPDSGFNQGRYYFDHFAGPNAADVVGAVAAQMSNGDTVTAGLVPAFNTVAACSNGTVLCRIGLVRYNASGVRVAWSNPGTYGFNGNQYVIFPGTAVAASYQYIRDVKVVNDTIYVMVDTGLNGGGGKDVRIISFNSDGSPILAGLTGVFGIGGASDTSDFYGAQIAVVSSSVMVVTATSYGSFGPAIVSNRVLIQPNRSLIQDPDWGAGFYGGGTTNRHISYAIPGGYCGAPVNCDSTASFAMAPVGSAPSVVYIAGSVLISQSNWDPVVLKISSENGSRETNFGNQGYAQVPFNEPNSSFQDFAAGLYVYQSDVYVAAQVSRKCHPGIGLAKIDGSNGSLVGAFGTGGKVVFGGQGNATFCIAPPGGDVPYAISATGGRIGIVGYSHHGIAGTSNFYDPMLAVVNATNGQVLDFAFHPVLRGDGTRYGDAVLYGIYGGPNPTSPFTVSGNGRDANAGNTLSFVTGRFAPSSADRIFVNGFDG